MPEIEMNPDPSARAREIAVLIANASIDATYADCDAGGVDPELEDDDWHALIGYRVIATLESAGIRLLDAETQVAVDRETVTWAHRAARHCRRSGEVDSQLIWRQVEKDLHAALHQRVRAGEEGGE